MAPNTNGTQSNTETLSERQLAREEGMVLMGRERALQQDLRALKRGEQTRAEVLTIEHLVPVAAASLQAQLDHYAASSGKRPIWHPVLSSLDLNEVAAGAIRAGFAGALKRQSRVRVLRGMALALEIVYAHSGLREAAKTRAQKQALVALKKTRTTPAARTKAILKAYAVIDQEHCWADDQGTQVRMGEPLLSAVLSTGLFQTTEQTRRGLTEVLITLSPDGEALVSEVADLGLLTRPVMRPMLTPPAPWTTPQTGAYQSEVVSSYVPLVRTPDGAHKALLARGVKDGSLAPVLEAVNAIQSVPLQINRGVLALREWAWATGVDVPDVFPLRTPVAVPEVPDDIASWPKRASNRFWASRAHAGRVNGGIASNVISFNGITEEARELALEAQFFLPHSMDFRGRVYPVPSFSYQSNDGTKALFQFARGQALGEFGLVWLKIHVANTGDFGKISKRPFEDRAAWADENLALITSVALSPREDLTWTQADKPFSFYAACVDLHAALQHPEGPEAYVSHLPVALDGSNSGVQHYAAAMRAEEGRYVNLTETEAPQDLYAVVATQVANTADRARFLVRGALARMGRTYPTRDQLVDYLDALCADVEDQETMAADLEARAKGPHLRTVSRLKGRIRLVCALLWAEEGVSRSTVKRGVMTYGYSSVAYGMAQQVRDDFMEPLALRVLKGELPRHPFGADEGKVAAGWMGRCIYRSVVQALPRVAAAMNWLQTTAGVLAHEGKGVLMVTPDGFPMLMKETEWETKKVELHLLDKALTVREAGPHDVVVQDSVLKRTQCMIRTGATKTVLKNKQQSGVAPNAIHTMDACHLRTTVARMVDLEIPDLAVIHDSFATHAGSVGTLSVVLREQLVALYEDYCPLADIQQRALKVLSPEGAQRLAPLPEKGTLDLQGIHGAHFAFS